MMEPPTTADETMERKKGTWNPQVNYLTNGNTYALTISPDPKRWFGFPNCRQQYIEVLPVIHKLFKNIGDYEIVPELNAKGYIHFHGYLTCRDRIKHAKTKAHILETLGIVYMKQIDDPQKWKEYIQKDKELMSELLKGTTPFPVTNDSWKRWLCNKKDTKKAVKAEGRKRGIMDLLASDGAVRARFTISD